MLLYGFHMCVPYGGCFHWHLLLRMAHDLRVHERFQLGGRGRLKARRAVAEPLWAEDQVGGWRGQACAAVALVWAGGDGWREQAVCHTGHSAPTCDQNLVVREDSSLVVCSLFIQCYNDWLTHMHQNLINRFALIYLSRDTKVLHGQNTKLYILK